MPLPLYCNGAKKKKMIMSTQSDVDRGCSTRLTVANGIGVPAVADMSSRVMQKLAQRILDRAYRKAEKKLMELDDRMLRDIGLSRSEIASAVRHSEQRQSQRQMTL